MSEAARNHRKIASSIREIVVVPFSRWCAAHESRVSGSQEELLSRTKLHDRQAERARKLRSNYFNKCRLVEDIEEENKLAFQDPASAEASPRPRQTSIPQIKLNENVDSDDEPEPMEIGDETYPPEQVKKIVAHMLTSIPLGETKVPILGTYQNTSSGAEIVEYLQQNLSVSAVSHAERVGQDLITHGFLRLVGNVGNSFANSSKMNYQWRPKSFQWAGVPDKNSLPSRAFSISSRLSESDSQVVGAVGEYLSTWNPLSIQHPNETPSNKLRREAFEADESYKIAVRKLDLLRCQLEESIVSHLKYMERCELDRLRAIKSVILDFSGTIGNVIPSLQSTVDKMLLFQETMQPAGDLRYLIENNRTGGFAPNVQIYENYYNSADEQTFGVDLEARARADKKRVPNIVTSILTFLDNHYPDMEGDEARRSAWLVDVSLEALHRLRGELNTGKPVSFDTLKHYEIPIVVGVLKLYLLELPGMSCVLDLCVANGTDSLVSSHVYEIVKTIYSTPASESSDSTRVSVIVNTLIQLRLDNIATLDALMTHFTRLIDLTSAPESFISALATSLAPCILRPRQENSMTLGEKHSYRLVRDLFAHKDTIFSELKRASAATASQSAMGTYDNQRPRATSTDESNRKVNMEARQRAILAATPGSNVTTIREKSPGPTPRGPGHRRDRSSAGADTRFPILTSPTAADGGGIRGRHSLGSNTRQNLDVPLANGPVAAVNGSSKTAGTHMSETQIGPPAGAHSGNNGTEAAGTPHMGSMTDDQQQPDMSSAPTRSASSANSAATSSIIDSYTTAEEANGTAEKDRNGLNRSTKAGGSGSSRFAAIRRNKPGSQGSLSRVEVNAGESGAEEAEKKPATKPDRRSIGVTLEDKPMDD
jgi:hypothetical protein